MKYLIGTKFLLYWDSTDTSPGEVKEIIGYVIDNTDRVKYLVNSNNSEYDDQYDLYTDADILDEISECYEKVKVDDPL